MMGESCPSSRLSLPSSCSASRCSGDTIAQGHFLDLARWGRKSRSTIQNRKPVLAASRQIKDAAVRETQVICFSFFFLEAHESSTVPTVSGSQISVRDSRNVKYGLSFRSRVMEGMNNAHKSLLAGCCRAGESLTYKPLDRKCHGFISLLALALLLIHL